MNPLVAMLLNAREPHPLETVLLADFNEMPPLTDKVVGVTPEGRNIYADVEGGRSSERSATAPVFPYENPWLNFPTIYGGTEYHPEDALDIIRRNQWVDPETQRRLDFYRTHEDAVRAARARSMGIPSGR